MIQVILLIPCLYLFLLVPTGLADRRIDSDVLTIDKPAISIEELHFPETDHIQPDESDFEIVNYLSLSSKSGQRLATVTVKNTSSGQRILTSNDIIAVFANGNKKPPFEINQKFAGREILSLNLDFGFNDFPILSIYTNN